MSSAITFRTVAAIAATVISIILWSGQARADDRIVAAAVNGSEIELLWLPEDLSWPPGGWRLERIREGEPENSVEFAVGLDEAALDRLDPDAAQGIREFADKLRRGTLSQEERELADAVFSVAAIINPDYGRALGLRYRDKGVDAGPVVYRLSALDAAGDPFRFVESHEIDTQDPAPLPHAPDNAAAEIGAGQVVVTWDNPPEVDAAPIAGYRVIRVEREGATDLTPDLHLRTIDETEIQIRLIDTGAPEDQMFAYDLASVDVFGRSSTPKRILVSVDRLALAVIAQDLAAEAGAGAATLTWSAVDHPGIAGYVLERALFIGGPYEAVTPTGVPVGETRFESTQLSPGAAYYFRIRVFDRDGNLGLPSLPVKIVPLAAAPPPPPGDLTAVAGPTRVALSWTEPEEPVAGFFVYRRAEGERQWKRLNGSLTPEPFFIDRFNRGAVSDRKLSYQVQSIGFDNSASELSGPIDVVFGDLTIPPPPVVVSASGAGGTARIEFRPGAPEDETDRILVTRSDEETGPWLARGNALPADAGAFTDPDVEAGKTYWFELVAVDTAGNRSYPSDRVIVTVAPPDLPSPPAPTAFFQSDPFPHVAVKVGDIPDRLLVVVEARFDDDEKWYVVAGPIPDIGTINLTDISTDNTTISYRLVYQAADGSRGPPSSPTPVSIGQAR